MCVTSPPSGERSLRIYPERVRGARACLHASEPPHPALRATSAPLGEKGSHLRLPRRSASAAAPTTTRYSANMVAPACGGNGPAGCGDSIATICSATRNAMNANAGHAVRACALRLARPGRAGDGEQADFQRLLGHGIIPPAEPDLVAADPQFEVGAMHKKIQQPVRGDASADDDARPMRQSQQQARERAPRRSPTQTSSAANASTACVRGRATSPAAQDQR